MTRAWAIGSLDSGTLSTPDAVLGIDPGAGGAAVCLSLVSDQARVWRLRTRDLDGAKAVVMGNVFAGIKIRPAVYLERPQVNRKDNGKLGLASTFSFGSYFGGVLALLVHRGWSPELVRPQSWQAAVHMRKEKGEGMKARSAAAYADLFPHDPLPRSIYGNLNENEVDALLIAAYGVRRIGAVFRRWRFPGGK